LVLSYCSINYPINCSINKTELMGYLSALSQATL
jgi:hypothetical protein